MNRIKSNHWMAVMFAVFFLFCGCGSGRHEPMNSESAALKQPVSQHTESGSDGSRPAADGAAPNSAAPKDIVPDDALRQIESMDFTIEESPIDMDRYDLQADRAWKEAFLKAVTNQIPICGQDGEAAVFYKDLLRETGKLPYDQFLRAVRESDYFYLDFDGDGLPELTVDTEGPCVLKYHPEEDRVELYARKEEGWHLLGKGQMYAEFTESDKEALTRQYCYESEEQKFCLKDIFYWYGGWLKEPYLVTVDEWEDLAVEEETAKALLGGFFAATENAPRPMTYLSLFGDGENWGYMPGQDMPVRYEPEPREVLPVNDESGREWEAYRAMMEGDFSVVEDERWVSLQSRYEDDLKRGDQTCSWSYFLMDFNGDGVRELVIRLWPDGVNNTASFRWEDGHIKMWGSYGSGDSHGYQVPLADGRVLCVSWYQSSRQWWVERVDSKCRLIRERGYDTWESRNESPDQEDGTSESDDGTEEKRERFYHFQDYYHNGERCGSPVSLTEEEWGRIEDVIHGLFIPEEVWKPCSVFTPRSDRPDIPGVG